MRRTLWLALALLASCAPTRPEIAAPTAIARPAPQDDDSTCRAGPDGAPRAAAPQQLAERGIGGTGIRPAATGPSIQTAERGIGGTGIVGVVTGFASICLSGREVAFDPAVPVVVDGAPASAAVLRAGQFTTVEAGGPDDSLRARRIVVRHEVSGPVEEIGADGVLRVAGQRVIVGAQTWGAYPAAIGDWLAVSGLRAPGGEVDATRIDRRGPGEVLVHGVLLRDRGHLRIGALEILPAAGVLVTPGMNVTAVGRISGGLLYADTIEPDLLVLDPVGYFGPAVGVFVIEGYASLSGDRIRLGQRLDLLAPRGMDGFGPRRTIAEFARRGDGALAVTALHEAGTRLRGGSVPGMGRDMMAPAPGRFEPAPTPHRGAGERGAGRGNPGGPGAGRQGYGRGGANQGQQRQGFGGGQDNDGPSGGGFAPGGGDAGFRRR
jgi:hypothetical protein